MTTAARQKAVRDFLAIYGSGPYYAMMDLLTGMLEEAVAALEAADERSEIWRAQGRTRVLREIIAEITPKPVIN